MEGNIPDPHASVEACRHQPASLAPIQPQHTIHTTRTSILNRNVLHQLRHAPDINIGIEGSRGAMSRVGGPGECVDARTVVGPARGNQFSLFRIEENDFTGGLINRKEKC